MAVIIRVHTTLNKNSKNERIIKMLRKIKATAICLSFMMMINIIAPISIFAEEMNSKVYLHNDYTVNYEIANSWFESVSKQQINVTITNTGTEIIEDWELYYDFCGEIESIWNAKIETDENEYII